MIRVPGTATTDAGLSSLKDLTQLRILDLSHTQVTNAGLVNLQKLMNLETLYLGVTDVTVPGLEIVLQRPASTLFLGSERRKYWGGAFEESRPARGAANQSVQTWTMRGLASQRAFQAAAAEPLSYGSDGGRFGSRCVGTDHLARPSLDAHHRCQLRTCSDCHSSSLLNLDGTGITDAGLVHLHGLSKLKNLILTRTKVTGGGIEALRSSLVGCVIAADPVAVAPPPKVEKGGQLCRHSLGTPHFIRGDWKVENGELVQSSLGAWGDCPILVFGDNSLSSYNLTLDFKKTDGDDLIGAGFHWHGHDHFQLFALGAHQRFAELDSVAQRPNHMGGRPVEALRR